MSVPFTRSLAYVLRDQVANRGASLAFYRVASIPDARHVRVSVGANQVTIPRISSYSPTVGEAACCIAAGSTMIAIGAVGGAP